MTRDIRDASVLIVEDNPDNLFIMIELLRTKARVRYCNGRATGRQFFKLLDTLQDKAIDVILLDIQLPHEDGYAILEQIRKIPDLAKTKVVAFTANVSPADVRRAQDAGFDGFLGKPISLNRFPQQLASILQGEHVWEPN